MIATAHTGSPLAVSRERLECAVLWVALAVSSLVWIEPAPFDFLMVILIGLWLLSGLRIPADFSLPVVLTAILAVTGLVAALLSETAIPSARHIGITIFLLLAAIALGAYVAKTPERALNTIMSGYTVAAAIAVILGIAGYYSLFDGAHDIFTERDRARGGFKDPNVFGPFLVPPIVYGMLQFLSGDKRIGSIRSAILAFLCFGVLLSFSRGAWGNLVLAATIAAYLTFVSTRSLGKRLKFVLAAIAIAVVALAGLTFALSFDTIANMMDIRGKLIQPYDTSQRFVGATVAMDAILANPLGLGAVSFMKIHTAEPHNVYLYSFIIGGWLGGFTYLALVGYTLVIGLRTALTESPWRPYAILLFACFTAIAAEGLVIDTDHWRHFYILMACVWGLHSATKARTSHATRAREPDSSSAPRSVQFRTPRPSRTLTPVAATVPIVEIQTVQHRAPNPMHAAPVPRTILRIREKRRSATPTGPKPIVPPSPAPTRIARKQIAPMTPRSAFGVRKIETLAPRLNFGRRTTCREPAKPSGDQAN